MPQRKVSEMTRVEVEALMEKSTREVGAANQAYTQWSQLRTALAKLAGRLREEEKTDDEAWEHILALLAISTRKCEAIEEYCTKKRTLHEVLDNRLSQLEMNL